ncbi:MAG: NAD-dependent epimerase/dehydratase family protein, partial [Bacteroidota bacterium]
ANVVNLALYHDIEKLLHVSSIAAIGKPQKGGKLNERSKWIRSNYNSDYAISKYLSEQEVWRGMAEGLKVAVVNPSVIIGSGYWHRGTCELFNRVWKGQKLYPIGTTGFVDVRDVARMMIQLMDGPWENERFLANGENLSYLSFFTEVAKAIQREAPTIKATPFLTGIAWRAETLRTRIFGGQPIVTQSMAHTTARQYFYDNQKSINELDFSYTPIESTIRETGQQFLEAKKRGAEFSILPV